ncbi:MAG: hypothetical protein QOH70_2247 [Blastocatellia bacterium]|nr:hypothetical protein [Blastocatellia bacterium]
MRSGLQGRVVSSFARGTSLWIALLLCPLPLFSSEKSQNKIICREGFSLIRKVELAKKLSAITGWPDVTFDEHGVLQTGVKAAVGGSQMARDLLSKALSGSNVLILEDASNRQDVVFGRVVPGRWKNGAGEKPLAYVVLIDFADFDQLLGDTEALKAFDVGWGFMHEIDHVVNDSLDSSTLGIPGECEDHINQMRRECHLPLRTDYFFTFFPRAEESAFRTRFVRLAFDRDDVTKAKHRRYWLIWDATVVGGLNTVEPVAELR